MTDMQKFLIGALGWPFVLLTLLFTYDNAFAKCIVQQETVKLGNNIQQQTTETCDDNQQFDVGVIGFSGKLELFRHHPTYTNDFIHNGAICRWFMDSKFKNNDISNLEGIICKIGDNWTVIDKF